MTLGPLTWASGIAVAISAWVGVSSVLKATSAEKERKPPEFPAVVQVARGGEDLQVPATAVVELDGKPTVWVAEPDLHLFIATPIELGPREAETQHVQSGLLPGQFVVVGGILAGGADHAVEARLAAR